MESLLTITGMWHVLVILAWSGAIIVIVEKEYIIWSGINIILFLLFFHYIIKINIFGNFIQDPGRSLLYVFGYLLLGFIWSFIKWWQYVNKEAFTYKEKRYKWLSNQREKRKEAKLDLYGLGSITLDTKVPKEMIKDWFSYAWYLSNNKPSAVNHKRSISHWIIYWPISLLGSLLNDFIGKVIRIIVVKFRSFYEIITKNAYKNIEEKDE